jgi:hypothetical protein
VSDKKTRVFIGTETESYHCLTLRQVRSDGSIYLSAPNFSELTWCYLDATDEGIFPAILQNVPPGKLSIHGSGIAHIRDEANPNNCMIRIKGHYLQSAEGFGVRHLFTIYPSAPKIMHNTFTEQVRDQRITFTDGIIKPTALLFWAVPITKQKLTLDFNVEHRADHMNERGHPPFGFGAFPLSKHHIFWIGYQLSHMTDFPHKTLISYHDGGLVPFFVKTSDIEFDDKLERVEILFASPSYQFTNLPDQQRLVISFLRYSWFSAKSGLGLDPGHATR